VKGCVFRSSAVASFVDEHATRVDAGTVSVWSDEFGDRANVVAGPAPDVEHAHSIANALRRERAALVFGGEPRDQIEVADQPFGIGTIGVAKRVDGCCSYAGANRSARPSMQ
jgi:hypothetical protein